VKTKPSKRWKGMKPTRRNLNPWNLDGWNKVRLRKWARRAPLVGVFSERKVEDRHGVVLSLDVRGAYGKIVSTRTYLGSRTAMIERARQYVRSKQIRQMRRECGRPIAIQEESCDP